MNIRHLISTALIVPLLFAGRGLAQSVTWGNPQFVATDESGTPWSLQAYVGHPAYHTHDDANANGRWDEGESLSMDSRGAGFAATVGTAYLIAADTLAVPFTVSTSGDYDVGYQVHLSRMVFGAGYQYLGLGKSAYQLKQTIGLYSGSGQLVSSLNGSLHGTLFPTAESIYDYWEVVLEGIASAGLDLLTGPLKNAVKVNDMVETVRLLEDLKAIYDTLGYVGYIPDQLSNEPYSANTRVRLQAGVPYEFRFKNDSYIWAQVFSFGGQFTCSDVQMNVDSLSVTPAEELTIGYANPGPANAGQACTLQGQVTRNGIGVAGATVFLSSGSKGIGAEVATDANGNYTLNFSAPNVTGGYPLTINATHGGRSATAQFVLQINSIASGYDLGISAMTARPTAKPNTTLPVSITVHNYGSQTASGVLTTRIRRANGTSQVVDTVDVGTMAPAGDYTRDINVAVGSSTGYLAVVSDIDTSAGDINSGNNAKSVPVWIGDTSQIDCYDVGDWMPPMDPTNKTFGSVTVIWKGVNTSTGRASLNVNGSNVSVDPNQYYILANGLLAIFYESYGNIPNAFSFFRVGWPQATKSITVTPAYMEVMRGGEAAFLFTHNTAGSRVYHNMTTTMVGVADGGTIAPAVKIVRQTNDALYKVNSSNLTPKEYTWWVDVNQANPPEVFQKMRLKVTQDPDIGISAVVSSNGAATRSSAKQGRNAASAPTDPMPTYIEGDLIDIGADVTLSGASAIPATITGKLESTNGFALSIPVRLTNAANAQRIEVYGLDTRDMIPGEYSLNLASDVAGDLNISNNSAIASIRIAEKPPLSIVSQVFSPASNIYAGSSVEVGVQVLTSEGAPATSANVSAVVSLGGVETKYSLIHGGGGLYVFTLVPTDSGAHNMSFSAWMDGYSAGILDAGNLAVTNDPRAVLNVIASPPSNGWVSGESAYFSWAAKWPTNEAEKNFAWKLDENPWSASSENEFLLLTNLSHGFRSCSIKMVGQEQYTESATQLSFRVDAIFPQLDITGYSSNVVYVLSNIYEIAGTASDSDSGLRDVFIGGGETNQGTLGNWRFDLQLTEATNDVVVSALDAAGNVIQKNMTVVYVPINSTFDRDGDWIPDWWELSNSGGVTNTAPDSLAANGINTMREAFVLGLNPSDPSARFQVENLSAESIWARVRFISLSNRLYSLQMIDDFVPNAIWSNVPGAGPRLGVGGLDELSDPNPPVVKSFYRVTVDVP